ncbi:unnamed protein product, partial [Didymodactylos carnosus]
IYDILLPGFESYFENDECNNEDNSLSQDNNDDCEETCNDDSNDHFELVPLADDIIKCVSENLELLRLPCFAHRLQLVINDGVKHASNATAALTKVAKIAKCRHSSVLFAEELEKLSKTIPRATKCCSNTQFLTVTAVLNKPVNTFNDVEPILLNPLSVLDGRFKFQWITDRVLLSVLLLRPKSVLDEFYGFLKEENMTSDLIFKRANSYQSLNKLARKIMCVPATSAPVERVFSQSGLLMR